MEHCGRGRVWCHVWLSWCGSKALTCTVSWNLLLIIGPEAAQGRVVHCVWILLCLCLHIFNLKLRLLNDVLFVLNDVLFVCFGLFLPLFLWFVCLFYLQKSTDNKPSRDKFCLLFTRWTSLKPRYSNNKNKGKATPSWFVFYVPRAPLLILISANALRKQ